MKTLSKYYLASILLFLPFINQAYATDECAALTAPATLIETTGLICLKNIKVTDDSGTQYVKAALQWLGAENSGKFKLLSVETDTDSDNENTSFSVETGVLSIPKIDVPKGLGTERYIAELTAIEENGAYFFQIAGASVYFSSEYEPKVTWKPFGILEPEEKKQVELLNRSIPYAKIADAVYDFDNVMVDTWTLLEDKSRSSGMQAAVYEDMETNTLVLAFRGTEPCTFKNPGECLLDIAADSLLTLGEDGPQFSHAFKYAEEVVERYPDREIIVTGHSLGGGLAQAIGAALSLETFAFNSAPVPDDFFDKHPPVLVGEALNDIIHVIADIHDPVSNTDETGKFYRKAAHVSPLIQFDFDDKEIMPAELKKLKKLRLDRHGITELVENASSLLSIYRDGW